MGATPKSDNNSVACSSEMPMRTGLVCAGNNFVGGANAFESGNEMLTTKRKSKKGANMELLGWIGRAFEYIFLASISGLRCLPSAKPTSTSCVDFFGAFPP